MILADKIINERKKCGWSQEELAEKLNVSRQAVSKWEGAQSVPDLQKIVAMADLFGVTTDYLLKDEFETAETMPATLDLAEDRSPVKTVSLEDASSYIDLRRKTAPVIALGVVLCILSPVLIILLAGFSDSGVFGVTKKFAVGLGVPMLLVLVACAVFLFIRTAGQCEEYEYLEKEEFDTAYGVEGFVNREKAEFKSKKTLFLSVGVMLCILSPLPLIFCALMEFPDYFATSMTCVLLAIVAAGVYMIVRVSCENAAYNVLLQQEDYTPEEKNASRKLGSLSGIFWCTVTAVFLAIGFTRGAWDRAWIVFAVGGVLYAAVYGIAKAVISRDRK